MTQARHTLDSRLTPERLADIKAGRGSAHEQASRAAKAAGVRGGSPDATPYRPVALHADPRIVGPRWPYAVMRIKRILEGVAKSSSIEAAVNGAEYKSLAKEYVETYAFYLMRTRPAPVDRIDHNPFRHMSDFDAFKAFVRRVEDICDRSTGKLGSWYTR